MEGNALSNRNHKIYLFAVLIVFMLVFNTCMPLRTVKPSLKQCTYRTMLPSGRLFSVTIREDSTFEETSYWGKFSGTCYEYDENNKKYISCHSAILDSDTIEEFEGLHCVLCDYVGFVNDTTPAQVRMFDRDGYQIELSYLYFADQYGKELYSYNKRKMGDKDCSMIIPYGTAEIELAGENRGGTIGGCRYKPEYGSVNFYILPNFAIPGFWLKNVDSLYYIPSDVKIGDTSNYLLLPRVR